MAGERSILIVDDDRSLRETLAEQLQVDGEFVAEQAESIADAERRLTGGDHRLDALILDVGLPDGDGRDLCVKLRRHGIKLPIIMLTGSDDEADVVRGLDSGANDYIAKPFRLAELLARLRAQLRIFENSEDAVFTIGPYTFRPSAKLLQEPVKNRRIRLTEKEAAILKFLYRSGTPPGSAPGAAERGVGLQRRRHHAHAGDAHLPPPPRRSSRTRRTPVCLLPRGAALPPGSAGRAAGNGVTPP